MAKKAPKAGEKAALIHAANSSCYNPNCKEPLFVQREGHQIINFEIAHIRDELKPQSQQSDIGWRYWPDDINQDERNRFSNLILLCKACHKLIDKIAPRSYSVELLMEWKVENEGSKGSYLSHYFGDQNISEDVLEAALKIGIEEALNQRKVADIAIELKIGLFCGIDDYSGEHQVIFTPHVARVTQNIEQLFGNYSVSVINRSDFEVTIDEVGFRFDDGSAMRLTEVEGQRIRSRDVFEFKGNSASLMEESDIGSATDLFVKTVCGAETSSSEPIVRTFLRYLATRSWSPEN